MTGKPPRRISVGFTLMGVAQILLGLGLITWLYLIGDMSIAVVGFLIAISGATIAFVSMCRPQSDMFWLDLYRGCLYAVLGAMFITKPVASHSAVGLLVSAVLLVEGLFEVAPAFLLGFRNRKARVASGAYCVVAGAMIWRIWPETADGLIFFLLSVNMVMMGYSVFAAGLQANDQEKFEWFSLIGSIRQKAAPDIKLQVEAERAADTQSSVKISA